MLNMRDVVRPVIVPSFVDILDEEEDHRRTGHEPGQLNFKQSIRNNTGKPILVSTRAGMTYTVPSRMRHGDGIQGLYLMYTTDHNSNVKFNRHDILNDPDKKNAMCDALYDRSHGNRAMVGQDANQVNLKCLVTKQKLSSLGGSTYLQDLDLVIAFEDAVHLAPHPMTEPSALMGFGDGEFRINFKLVDNEGEIGTKYVNLTGEIMALTTITSSDLVSGLYVSYPPIAKPNGDRTECVPVKKFYSPEQLCATENREGFLRYTHDTYEKALTHGDSIAERERTLKLEMVELKQKHALELEELNKQKMDDEREKLKLEQHKREVEHARSMSSMDRKDYYENRSHIRKDSSEWLKYAPLVISVVAALVPIFRGSSWKS